MAPVIGCIGCGNMGKALLEGLAKSVSGAELLCNDRSQAKMDALAGLGVKALPAPLEVARKAQIIILAVKPGNMTEVLDEIAPAMAAEKMVLSIAAGCNLMRLRNHLGQKPGLCRVMPTTTAQVGKGIFAVCFDPLTKDQARKTEILKLLEGLGLCMEVPEASFPAFSAFMGAGPAYVFEMLAALAQAGVTLGFPAAISRKMIIELVEGCALLAANDGSAFMDLRDNVCSPAGLTIAGINEMDKAGFIGTVVRAVEAADRRAREMEN